MDINNPLHRRFAILLAKCEVVNGKPGGLVEDEAKEFQELADKIGVKIEWQRFDLLTQTWVEHPSKANYQAWLAERRAREASVEES